MRTVNVVLLSAYFDERRLPIIDLKRMGLEAVESP